MSKRKKVTKSAPPSHCKRAALRAALDEEREARTRAELYRQMIRAEHRNKKLPREGSLWAKHPAMRQEHEPEWVYTFVLWAYAEDSSRQLAVLEHASDDLPGEPYRKVVEMWALLVEWVEVRR